MDQAEQVELSNVANTNTLLRVKQHYRVRLDTDCSINNLEFPNHYFVKALYGRGPQGHKTENRTQDAGMGWAESYQQIMRSNLTETNVIV